MKRLAAVLLALSLTAGLTLAAPAPVSAQSVVDVGVNATNAVANIAFGSWINCGKGIGDEAWHMADRAYIFAPLTAASSCIGNGVGTIVFSVGDFFTSPFKKQNVVPAFYSSFQPPFPLPKQ